MTQEVERAVPFNPKTLYEQGASAFLDILDETGKPPRIQQVVDLVAERHPNYDHTQIGTWLKEGEFDTYLQERRKRYQQDRAAIKLIAAEMGGKVGKMALEQLSDQLANGKRVLVRHRDGTSEIESVDLETKDLIAAAKLGIDLNASLTEDTPSVKSDVTITVNMKDVLMNLDADRAAEISARMGRRWAAPQTKAEVIDATISAEE